jgi:hypothetical protein
LDPCRDICAAIGSLGVSIFGARRSTTPSSGILSLAYSVSYIPHLALDATQFIIEVSNLRWNVTMNFTVITLGTEFENPEVKGAFLAAQSLCTIVYGVFTL